MLNTLLNRQWKVALSYLLAGLLTIIGIIVMVTAGKTWIQGSSGGYGSYWGSAQSLGGHYQTNNGAFFAGVALVVIGQISQFVLWIIGIVGAFRINGLTGDSTILIVFSILTFWFGHLIVAVIQRNKFLGTSPIRQARTASPTVKSHEDKLKESFTSGVITSAEYEKKLKEHRSKK